MNVENTMKGTVAMQYMDTWLLCKSLNFLIYMFAAMFAIEATFSAYILQVRWPNVCSFATTEIAGKQPGIGVLLALGCARLQGAKLSSNELTCWTS